MCRKHSKYETCALCTNKNIYINIESMRKLQLGFQERTYMYANTHEFFFDYSKSIFKKEATQHAQKIDKKDHNDKW